MKKTILFIAFCAVIGLTTQAQVIPNAGFENWTTAPGQSYKNPNGYATSNQSTVVPVTRDTINPHGGNVCMKLTNLYYLVVVVPAVAGTGTLNQSNLSINGGFPWTTKPQTFDGFYTYAPGAADSCLMMAMLTHWNGSSRDTVAVARFQSPASAAGWTAFSSWFQYKNFNLTPDTGFVLFSASSWLPSHAVQNSVLRVDDISFNGTSNQIVEPVTLPLVKVMTDLPNALVYFEVTNSVVSSIEVLNSNGQTVGQLQVQQGSNRMNDAGLPAGEYFYQLRNKERTSLGGGKFVIAR